jgi:mannosyl-oligosaccharide alpha-1,3-glucosidase
MTTPIRIGYVPEHYLLPLHLAKSKFPFLVELIPFPSGTGHMITSLRSDSVDICIGLTEGWIAGLLNEAGQKAKGYNIVGSWVENPLRWAIVTGRNRDKINTVEDLKHNRQVGVSRMGSGSHVMAFVLAQQEGWLKSTKDAESEGLVIVPLGPFADLRDGVTGKGGEAATADFFMWEHFTTKPYFHGDGTPLKKIGEIYTPWPSWHIAASTKAFPDPEADDRLKQLFTTLDQGVKEFTANPDQGITMLGTGELGCHYTEEDAREWLKGVKFFGQTRGVSGDVMAGVVKVLQSAGVIEASMEVKNGDGVVGIRRA